MALKCVVLVERVVILILDDCCHSQFLSLEEPQLNDTKEENADQKQQMQALRKCIVSVLGDAIQMNSSNTKVTYEHSPTTETTSSFRLA